MIAPETANTSANFTGGQLATVGSLGLASGGTGIGGGGSTVYRAAAGTSTSASSDNPVATVSF